MGMLLLRLYIVCTFNPLILNVFSHQSSFILIGVESIKLITSLLSNISFCCISDIKYKNKSLNILQSLFLLASDNVDLHIDCFKDK